MQQSARNSASLRWLPSALLAAACAAAALEARRLGLGEASKPGPGFFPFWLSVVLAVVALLLSAGVGRGEPSPDSQPGAPLVKLTQLPVSLQAFLALCLYCVLLIPAGFFASTWLFFALEARIIERAKCADSAEGQTPNERYSGERLSWPRAALLGAVATVVSYGLFTLLDVQLPAGLWLE